MRNSFVNFTRKARLILSLGRITFDDYWIPVKVAEGGVKMGVHRNVSQKFQPGSRNGQMLISFYWSFFLDIIAHSSWIFIALKHFTFSIASCFSATSFEALNRLLLCWFILALGATPSIAMYSNFRGRTIEKMRSMYSKIRTWKHFFPLENFYEREAFSVQARRVMHSQTSRLPSPAPVCLQDECRDGWCRSCPDIDYRTPKNSILKCCHLESFGFNEHFSIIPSQSNLSKLLDRKIRRKCSLK